MSYRSYGNYRNTFAVKQKKEKTQNLKQGRLETIDMEKIPTEFALKTKLTGPFHMTVTRN